MTTVLYKDYIPTTTDQKVHDNKTEVKTKLLRYLTAT